MIWITRSIRAISPASSNPGVVTEADIRANIVSIGQVAAGQWRGRANPSGSVYAVIQGLTALDRSLAYRIYQNSAN